MNQNITNAGNSHIFQPSVMLHLDGAAMLLLAVLVYIQIDGNWLLFGLLFFAPDLFMLGYLWGPRLGAACYNIGHSILLALIIIGIGLVGPALMLAVGIIWMAHIGFDRLLGYGFKYDTGFKNTHFQRV